MREPCGQAWIDLHTAEEGFDPDSAPQSPEPFSVLLIHSIQTKPTVHGYVWQVRTRPCERCHSGHWLLVGSADRKPACDGERYQVSCGEEVLLAWPDPDTVRAQAVVEKQRKRGSGTGRAEEIRRRRERRMVRRLQEEARLERSLRDTPLMDEIARQVADQVLGEFVASLCEENYERVTTTIRDVEMRQEVLAALPPIEVPADFTSRVQEEAHDAWRQHLEGVEE